uniref:AMOP domain protein n=1 Tax=Haemonchus contortus TaxID=6289 RepID=A0A7I4YAX7_HAECO|nr:Nidogen and AMOP domain containing protein [Haemonchus contortus]
MFGSCLRLLLLAISTSHNCNAQQAQQAFIRQIQPVQQFQDLGLQNTASFTEYEGNLVRYGEEFGDRYISDNQRQNGLNIRLHNFFPFYGGRYNYTLISTNGYISFAYFSDDSSTLQLGLDVDWPTQSDPAVIAPYLCKQRIQSGQGVDSRVFYRVETRRGAVQAVRDPLAGRAPCLGKPAHFRCDDQSEQFLDALQRALQQGVAGASTFRAEAALVVTWKNMRPNIGSELGLSTYQLVWMSDAQGLISYSMINYYKLGFDAADMYGNSRTGKCQAIFNGGNHTGSVQVDLSEITKQQPSSLASRSAVPHVTRGRYFHRTDDVVRPAGCGNKTGGTFPLLIYPNIVTMLGQTKVDVNGMCLNHAITYVLMIEQRQMAKCDILNPSIARCTLPKILDWGTKTVYFQPQSGLSNDEKAYVGFIYFVPPTLDPMRLDIGNIHSWYINPPPTQMTIKWYPRNFTAPRTFGATETVNYFDDSVYNVQLGLYVVGYKEAQDVNLRKFVPQHRVLARLATYQNRVDEQHRWNPIIESYQLDRVDEWYLSRYEMHEDLFTYRFGYLKLAPMVQAEAKTAEDRGRFVDLPEGIISSPISLHWLWTLPPEGEFKGNKQDKQEKLAFVKEKSRQMCHEWFNEDGALANFIRETETNSSCPCKEEQAKMDLGRFMPHPRCSALFRDVSCTETLGSMNCYMSAQNVRGSTYRMSNEGHERESAYSTHYGQTCCYDAQGFLMQSTYQPVVKIDESTPYSPGVPTRAFELGSAPFQGMFEVPGLSTFHHDIMPYYLCCKFADFRCQLFYWRRPSSACQAYEPAVSGSILGAGIVSTLNNRNFVFNEPGIFTLLHSHRTSSTPEVQIQVRMERFPDRSVDFGALNIAQRDLVQPTNATVITGVVLSSDSADRVHIVLRKDTYRQRYKTSVIVGNVIRYFDNMHIQRFRGVTVYVNNVEKGQSEIYVVLDQAQIGMRIRESYAIDIDRKFNYMESLGLLDVQISVPPQYKVLNQPSVVRTADTPRVEGLINPFPDEPFQQQFSQLTWTSVNDQGIRGQLMKYKIKGEMETMNVNLQADDVSDLFASRSDRENLFQAYADHFLKGPVYKMASKYQTSRYAFRPQNENDFRNFLAFCRTPRRDPDYEFPEERQLYLRCPTDLASLESDCGNDVACLYDSVMLQARLLGDEARMSYNYYLTQRIEGAARYNSCGAMNIEYPEYLIKGPSSGEPAYLEGDKLSFSCFQTHIIKGDTEFQCQKIRNEDDNTWRMQWTQGGQPWCRHRAKDNILVWLQWMSITLGIILALVGIFAVCWIIKQSDRKKRTSPPRISSTVGPEAEPLTVYEKPRVFAQPSEASDIPMFEREPRSRPLGQTRTISPPGYSVESSPSRHTSPLARPPEFSSV